MHTQRRTRSTQHLFVKNQLFQLLLLLPLIFTTCCHARPASNRDASAATIYYENQPPDAAGNYNFKFQTSNGITTKAAGNENGAVGVVQYVSKEGLPITFTYVADENGYQPSGDFQPTHLPRLLEYLRTHPHVDEQKSRRL